MSRANTVVVVLVAVGLLTIVLLVPWWPLGWRGRQYWVIAGALGTVVAAIGAIVYVVLTYRLWREAAGQREGDLMLRLIDEYDRLRDDIMRVQEWTEFCREQGIEPVERFKFEAPGRLRDFEELDQARFRISRFFVRTRRLVRAGFLSEEIVVAALERAAVEKVFLKIVDPLDEAKAGMKYQAEDRDFYTALLRRYPKEEKQ